MTAEATDATATAASEVPHEAVAPAGAQGLPGRAHPDRRVRVEMTVVATAPTIAVPAAAAIAAVTAPRAEAAVTVVATVPMTVVPAAAAIAAVTAPRAAAAVTVVAAVP